MAFSLRRDAEAAALSQREVQGRDSQLCEPKASFYACSGVARVLQAAVAHVKVCLSRAVRSLADVVISSHHRGPRKLKHVTSVLCLWYFVKGDIFKKRNQKMVFKVVSKSG